MGTSRTLGCLVLLVVLVGSCRSTGLTGTFKLNSQSGTRPPKPPLPPTGLVPPFSAAACPSGCHTVTGTDTICADGVCLNLGNSQSLQGDLAHNRVGLSEMLTGLRPQAGGRGREAHHRTQQFSVSSSHSALGYPQHDPPYNPACVNPAGRCCIFVCLVCSGFGDRALQRP